MGVKNKYRWLSSLLVALSLAFWGCGEDVPFYSAKIRVLSPANAALTAIEIDLVSGCAFPTKFKNWDVLLNEELKGASRTIRVAYSEVRVTGAAAISAGAADLLFLQDTLGNPLPGIRPALLAGPDTLLVDDTGTPLPPTSPFLVPQVMGDPLSADPACVQFVVTNEPDATLNLASPAPAVTGRLNPDLGMGNRCFVLDRVIVLPVPGSPPNPLEPCQP